MRKVLGFMVVLSLTGCASLPMSGPVRIGPDLTASTGEETFYYSPSSPVEGATQAEILSGFLAAGTGPQNDYAVAREFLSENIRSTWSPNQEVLVQRSSPTINVFDDNTATVDIDVAARVDADGIYQVSPTSSSRQLEFSFVLEGDQWRLSKAPDLTVLIRPVFDVVFSSYSVYFLDRQKNYLVPEVRWFPSTPATGTRLANALLRGASDWLKPAVVSAIPSGTRLSIDAVAVENGVALVDLTARALVATRSDRSLMKAQLEATLSQLPNVAEVAISIERSRQDIPDTQGPPLRVGSRPLAILTEAGLEALASSDAEFFQSGEEFFAQTETSLLSLSKESEQLALISEGMVLRTQSNRPGSEVELVDQRPGIVAIEYDRQGYLWSLSQLRGASVQVAISNAAATTLIAPWLEGESVRAFAISPEGTRAVVLVAGRERNRVLLTSVVRSQSGQPIELSEPIEVFSEIASPTAISWTDETTVAIVNSTGDFVNAFLATVGGGVRAIPAVSGTLALVSGGAGSQLYLLTSSGVLYTFRGSSWSSLREGVRALTVIN